MHSHALSLSSSLSQGHCLGRGRATLQPTAKSGVIYLNSPPSTQSHQHQQLYCMSGTIKNGLDANGKQKWRASRAGRRKTQHAAQA